MSENKPFHALGGHLKSLRQQSKESLAEVSGAVEIDIEFLESIEQGSQRPSEDVLMLLINHFNPKDDEATQLWELAGYSQQKSSSANLMNDISSQLQSAVMVMPVDLRIVYTDMAHVIVNNYGVVMNFMQTSGPNNQPLAVARIGMSKEHAQSVLDLLQKTLNQSNPTPKSLPAPKSKKGNSGKTSSEKNT